ncbi:MAG: hypothetical protein JNG83_11350 [Opitutaceae bacterium]|nr:hypothetical protein [Opitutaceae bacterium]
MRAAPVVRPSGPDWIRLPSVPDPEGFAAPFAGVTGGALLLAGGANFPGPRPWEGGTKVWYDSIYVLPPGAAAWQAAGRLPAPCAYGLSVPLPDGVACIGGGDARTHTARVQVLSWDGRALRRREGPPLPGPCAFMTGARVGSRIYVLGGIDRPDATTARPDFWAWDFTRPGGGWSALPPLPGPARILALAGAAGEGLLVASGASLHAGAGKAERTYLADAYVYDPARGWRRVADLPRPAVAAPTPLPVTADGRLLVVGGDDGTRRHLDGPGHPGFPSDILAYDPVADCWSPAGEAPVSRATAPTAEWQGRWVVLNGERRPGERSPEVWAGAVGLKAEGGA